MRVISVLPSATEVVCALGHGTELVARSSECDYPPEVRELPVVMRPRTLDSERPSREIDARVRESRGRGESLYELDQELLRELRPDLLLTQDLCGVCSVTEEEVTQACALAGVHPRIVSLQPTRLSEVWDSIETVARALGDPEPGRRLANALRTRTRPRSPTGSTVAVVEWIDPPILAGLWTPDLILAAGGTPVGPLPGEAGVRTTWGALRVRAPDLVVLSPCSFSVDRSRRELSDPKVAREVSAVRASLGTFLADEAYFSRPGPRIADGAELIRNMLDGKVPDGPMPVAPYEAAAPRAGR
jgi:iron complex transport system substrate-binding protein